MIQFSHCFALQLKLSCVQIFNAKQLVQKM